MNPLSALGLVVEAGLAEQDVVVVADSQRQAAENFHLCEQAANKVAKISSITRLYRREEIRFCNGSSIRFVAVTGNGLRGASAGTVVIDEHHRIAHLDQVREDAAVVVCSRAGNIVLA